MTAVDDVSFVIEPGKLVTLLGPSGCGKTTTLRLIAGLEMASEGQILIGGRDVTRLSAADRDVSMVFQSYALFPHMSVLDNVAYGPSVQGLPKKKAHEMAFDKLKLVGLYGSRAAASPRNFRADSSSASPSPARSCWSRRSCCSTSRFRTSTRNCAAGCATTSGELQQDLNLTVAYVTHDQEEALAVSDRIIVMSNARIAQTGTPRELYEEPADIFVADFIGDANIYDAELVEERGERALVRLGELTLELPRRGLAKGPAKVAIRPNTISIHGDRPATPSLPGRVRKAVYLGKNWEITVDCSLGETLVTPPNGGDLATPGREIWLGIAPEKVTLIPPGA